MANKQALRDLQSRLAQRLLAARTDLPGTSWLAVEAGGHGFLLPLKEAGEIFSLAPVLPVPHCRDWFSGVTNLRGHLHGVVDLARFLGLPTAPSPPVAGRVPAQWVGFNAAYDLNCVLRVDRLAGLRSDAQMRPAAPAADAELTGTELSGTELTATSTRPAFAGVRLCDASGRVWQELRLAALAVDAAFLSISA